MQIRWDLKMHGGGGGNTGLNPSELAGKLTGSSNTQSHNFGKFLGRSSRDVILKSYEEKRLMENIKFLTVDIC